MAARATGPTSTTARHLAKRDAPDRRRRRAVRGLVALLVGAVALTGLVAPSASAAVETITFRASASSAATVTTHRVAVPATVQPGDGMLLFATTNTLATVATPPAGWTFRGSRQSGSDTMTHFYSTVATAGDAGTDEAITYSAATKGTLTLLAYDGTAADPVATFASAAETRNSPAHTTPGATVAEDGAMVVSYWADKSSSTTGWDVPAGQIERALALGTGSGRITSVASDSGSPSVAGPSAPQTATVVGTGSGKATMWTVVLRAAEQTPDTDAAPVASFTTDCQQLTCTFDASASTDTDGSVRSYAWDFGDGTTGTGVTATRTYAGSGDRTVTLTVTDDEGLASTPATRTVTPTSAPTTSDAIAFRAAAEAAFTQTTARVAVPAAVRETDGMLLFVTTNTAGVSITVPPAGWTLEGSRLDTDTLTTVYSKVAAADDAGRNAAVTFSATTKSTVTLLAYDGTAADPTAVVASAAETTFRAAHTTPGATVSTAGSWVVSYWADKSSGTTGWTLPAGQTRRSLAVGTGSGRITSVASDLNAVAPVGGSAGRTATATASSGKATMWTVVLQPDTTSAPNAAPVASFTVTCPQATCTVDGSGSTDTAPGTVASYAWDFGDGTTGTGVTATHTYATGGPKTITLTVTDDQGLASAPATRTANPVVGGGAGNQPVPAHSRLVPERPRTNTPRISDGEIWDIEVVGTGNAARVFIAGGFTGAQNTTGTNTTFVNQPFLLSYNLSTGLIDTSFRPTFGGGGVIAVEASPDGTKLFVGGSFNTVNGVTKQKVASLDLTTGAPLSTFGFTNVTNNEVQSLAASNSTLYVGGRYTRINGQLRTGLAAVDAASGAVDLGFDNQLAGGIGVNGQLGVPQLKLTHDGTKLLVVHTGRQIDGQDRLGMGIIDTASKELLPWRSTLWDDHLARVGGVTRIYAADIAPDDSYFVVTSGSGGDAPPIQDTAIRFPLTADSLQDPDVQPTWISRHFDSIYSVAITEVAVYVGGHFGFIESPTSADPWPGLDNVGYGTGQGLGGYGLGDQVVRRDHIAAISPTNGKALEWYPLGGSNSFEGDKAMEATPRGLLVGGDGMLKGGVRTGRVAFFDLATVQDPPAAPDTTITTPIEGRVVANGQPFEITGTARVASGTVGRVQVQIQDRDSKQFLQDDGTAFTTEFGAANTLNAVLDPGTGTTRTWRVPATIATTRNLLVSAQAWTAPTGGSGDTTRATQQIESFGLDDATPTTSITGPASLQSSTTFTVTGTASDDEGVSSLSFWFRDEQNRYLQADGTVDAVFNSFRGTPDVIGATSATWSYEVTLPHEGIWRGSATATDTAGQADLRSAVRDWRVDSTAVAPTITVNQPVAMTPPFAVPTVVVTPGEPITFSGTASDDEGLRNVEILLRNTTTRENLGADGSWGIGVRYDWRRVSPTDVNGTTYNWSYTTPFDLSPGSYQFAVRGTDDEGLSTATTDQGRLALSAQVAGDAPPNALVTGGGTFAVTDPQVALTGTATDDKGVQRVELTVFDNDTGRYLQDDGSMVATWNTVPADLASPGATSTAWSYGLVLPGAGDFSVTAFGFDTAGQQDSSTTGATARYRYYPGDALPGFNDTLGQPVTGTAFTEGRIVVTGRAEDDLSIARVEVAVVDSAGRYMSSTGTFTSTTASYRPAFLNSPGSPASNYSYTTPVIPDGTYTVHVRAMDHHDQYSALRTSTDITVTRPPNEAPVASGSVTCVENVCSFDGRSSTDENASSLTYSWNFGPGQGTATGPVPKRTYTAPGTYTPTLVVTDEWRVASTTFTLPPITITEPAGNTAPTPVAAVSCTALVCAVSSAGTTDRDSGDVITYSWAWGDGTANNTTASASHTYAQQGSYTLTLTATDGWGNTASTTRTLSLMEPTGNRAPTAVFTPTCTGLVCALSTTGTSDPDGDQVRYAWTFGDGTTSTAATPTKTYTAAGEYTISLTVTDGWNRSTTVSQQVAVAPASP